jgi:SAM-dependent methyltransferase
VPRAVTAGAPDSRTCVGGYRVTAMNPGSGEAMRSTGGEEVNWLLDEQVTYYRALAPDYLGQGLDLPGADELTQALEAFRPTGSVLELACGPGVWTGQLLRYATDVTAVDASPEMLALAAARVDDQRVRFVQADLFTWVPDRRYDVVFLGFWLSHVPLERFESFWSLVADCLAEGGRVFFVDDGYRTPDELVEGPSSSTIQRRLDDGRAYRLVKVAHRPADLEQRFRRLGWDIKVTFTSRPFYWGAGTRNRRIGLAVWPYRLGSRETCVTEAGHIQGT